MLRIIINYFFVYKGRVLHNILEFSQLSDLVVFMPFLHYCINPFSQ